MSKIILPQHKITDIEIGDRFLNTSWTVCGQWYREYDSGKRLRSYVPVKCDCGEIQRGRWDRLHTTDINKAPWSTRCRKCSAGGKKRAVDSIWHNVSKKPTIRPQNKINDLSGQYFGDLFVIKRAGTNKGAHSLYECRCSCGNIEIISDNRLKAGKKVCTKCSGKVSIGEEYIKKILDRKKIRYIRQYTFDDLVGEDRPLRFDFALFNSKDNLCALIEFQGKQHYEAVEYFGGEKQFKKQKAYDDKKRKYCKEHGLKLIEIPYTMTPEQIKQKIVDELNN